MSVPTRNPESSSPNHESQKPLSHDEIKRELDQIDQLRANFDQELEFSEETGDLSRVHKLRQEIDDRLTVIKARVEAVQAFSPSEEQETEPLPETWRPMFEKAKEIFNGEVYGPDEVERALGIKIDRRRIPDIPFNDLEMVGAQRHFHFLTLRVDKTKDGTPLTMQNLGKMHNGVTVRRLFRSTDEYNEQPFFTKSAPTFGWVLAPSRIISAGERHFVEQTAALATYLEEVVYDSAKTGIAMPSRVKDMIQRFRSMAGSIVQTLNSNTQRDKNALVMKVHSLDINKSFRPTPVELTYDMLVARNANRKLLFKNSLVWTNELIGKNRIVALGRSNFATGITVELLQALNIERDSGVAFQISKH
jgi:hypothetical protein